jgi:peptidoglycan lytic transglycosylase
VFHLRRFRWKRRRAALALLPAAAMMVTLGIAGAATGTGPVSAVGGPGTDAAASGGPATVKFDVRRHVMVGDSVAIHGRLSTADSRLVLVKVDGRKVKTVRSQEDGSFRARWRASHTGVFEAYAVAGGNAVARTARSRSTRVNVYRPATASYYGPGLYGNGTACGRTLTPSTVGVAHRTLPCGTRVTLRYRGRTVTVPVIDRGPFSGSHEYDLTATIKTELGFGSTGNVLTTR